MKKINFNFEIDNAYKYDRLRTGLFTKESEDFSKKYKIGLVIDILKYNNIIYTFDAMGHKDNNFILTLTGCNYGLLIFHINPFFTDYLYNKYIANKQKLDCNFDINLSLDNRNFKYYNKSISFDKEIKNLVILSSIKKHRIVNWKLLNEKMYEKNSYLKCHPIMDFGTKKYLKKKYGEDKVLESNYILDELIEKAENIAFTGCTESMFTISLLNKNMIFLHDPVLRIKNITLTYYIIFKSLYNGYNISDVVKTGITGLIPWEYINNKKFIINYLEFLKNEHVNWKNSGYYNTEQR